MHHLYPNIWREPQHTSSRDNIRIKQPTTQQTLVGRWRCVPGQKRSWSDGKSCNMQRNLNHKNLVELLFIVGVNFSF